ncbi:MAG: tRNA pseudouridine(55) synthase TruB [Elusimicrobiota bacterium]|jgi:tRNA pseudouridine55 synthase|nr:tRNA pseudouridine(55) synthase TruB [Elusimicrobiota bacterium]
MLCDGMLLIDKPKNITSFKVCHIIRKTLNIKKTGHCGTLDPSATGLLLVLTGKATKLQDKFMKQDKIYRTSFMLGCSTDSGDMDGKILEKKDFNHIDLQMIKTALENFKGEIEQIPPMYSAIKINGQKLYELARKGIEIKREPRKINIKDIEIISFKEGILDLSIECSSGTYIRSIADDLGKILGCGAVVSALRREKIGSLDVKNAVNQDYFQNPEALIEKIISIEQLNEN